MKLVPLFLVEHQHRADKDYMCLEEIISKEGLWTTLLFVVAVQLQCWLKVCLSVLYILNYINCFVFSLLFFVRQKLIFLKRLIACFVDPDCSSHRPSNPSSNTSRSSVPRTDNKKEYSDSIMYGEIPTQFFFSLCSIDFFRLFNISFIIQI